MPTSVLVCRRCHRPHISPLKSFPSKRGSRGGHVCSVRGVVATNKERRLQGRRQTRAPGNSSALLYPSLIDFQNLQRFPVLHISFIRMRETPRATYMRVHQEASVYDVWVEGRGMKIYTLNTYMDEQNVHKLCRQRSDVIQYMCLWTSYVGAQRSKLRGRYLRKPR